MLIVPGRMEEKELFILAPEAVCISCRTKMNDVILRHEARKSRKKELELISYSWQGVPLFLFPPPCLYQILSNHHPRFFVVLFL